MEAKMEENSDLEKVREEFEKWRERKIGGQAIPEELLERAAQLLKSHTMSKVTQVLRLSGQRLSIYVRKSKQKTEQKTDTPKNNKAEKFLTFTAESLRKNTLKSNEGQESLNNTYRIVIERYDGSRMSVCVPQTEWSRVEVLLTSFIRS
jgi:hypothetical protein